MICLHCVVIFNCASACMSVTYRVHYKSTVVLSHRKYSNDFVAHRKKVKAPLREAPTDSFLITILALFPVIYIPYRVILDLFAVIYIPYRNLINASEERRLVAYTFK